MTVFNRFQGDPAIEITPDGVSMKFIGGQPVMDQGLQNTVIISLFTKPGWWGNILTGEPGKRIGSDFEKIRTIIDIQTLTDVKRAAERALADMKESGLADEIKVETYNPIGDQIHTNIMIKPKGTSQKNFVFTQNGKLWIGQAKHPTQERLNAV